MGQRLVNVVTYVAIFTGTLTFLWLTGRLPAWLNPFASQTPTISRTYPVSGVPAELLREGPNPIPQGFPAHDFWQRARRGPVTLADCLAAGGIRGPGLRGVEDRRVLTPGVLVVYHLAHKREYLLVGYGERATALWGLVQLSGVTSVDSCLFAMH